MKFHRVSLQIIAAIALTVAPLGLFARPPKADASVLKHVDIPRTMMVSGTQLTPGMYNVVIANGKAMFEQDGKTMASENCQWKTLPAKAAYDSVTTSETNALQEIDFGGSTRALTLG